MKTYELIENFIANHADIPASADPKHRPNWVYFEFATTTTDGSRVGYGGLYDFKSAPARQMFGAICMACYNSNRPWVITTRNDV